MNRIHCASVGRGQFLQPCALPLGTPDVLRGTQGRKAWWRVHRDTPTGRVGYLEAWGEDVDSDSTVTLEPGEDIERVLLPEVLEMLKMIQEGSSHLDLVGAGSFAIDGASWLAAPLQTGASLSTVWVNAGVRVDIEVLAFWRSPYVLIMLGVSRLSGATYGRSPAGKFWVHGSEGSVPFSDGLVGTQGGGFGHLVPNQLLLNPEVDHAIANHWTLERPALVDSWTTDFCGVPTPSPIWSLVEAERYAGALTPRPDPDQPGVDGSYGASVASVLWTRQGACVASLPKLVAAADAYCGRQDSWVLADGREVPPWPARRNLSVDEGQPWLGLSGGNDRNDPRDDLGYDLPRGSEWPHPANGVLPADKQHESIAPLVAAALLTNNLRYRLVARRKAVVQGGYERSWWATLHPQEPADWTPHGRGCARPSLMMALASSIDAETFAICAPIARRRYDHLAHKFRGQGIPLSMPSILPSYPPQRLAQGYEEGLNAQAALLWWRLTRHPSMLACAHRYGRFTATTAFAVSAPLRDTYWGTYYVSPVHPDGTPTAMHEPDVQLSVGRWLTKWHVGGLNAYLAALVAMNEAGMRVEDDEPLWASVAQAAAAFLEQMQVDGGGPEEHAAAANQGLFGVPITSLATPTMPVTR